MKKFALAALLILVLILTGCSDKITEEDLIGGKWSATAGFENEEANGEPICGNYAHGLKFIDKKTVYVEYRKENFDYNLRETDKGIMQIDFYPPGGGIDSYNMHKVNENAFGINATYGNFKNGCFLEREK